MDYDGPLDLNLPIKVAATASLGLRILIVAVVLRGFAVLSLITTHNETSGVEGIENAQRRSPWAVKVAGDDWRPEAPLTHKA